MKRILLSMTLALGVSQTNAQLTADDIVYYVGSGPDTAYCVIDFQDGSSDTSYAWGYLFDATVTTTGANMLAAIAADEPQIDIDLGGGFLNDITYNTHAGIGGSPDYWGTWSRTASTAWATNSGIGEVLANGDWFGCSYMDFSPAIEPGEQYAAYDSKKWSSNDIQYWIGTGNDSAILVIDFVTPTFSEAVTYAWGYRFDGTTDGATMLADIASADVNLTVNAAGFLNDIYFNGKIGEAGSPYYWGTFSGTNLSDWTLNAGLSTTIGNGDWFGCTYASWEPRRPFYPLAAIDSADFEFSDVTAWYGTGLDSAVIVVDFNESIPGESFAFGYLFDGSATGEDAMNALAAGEPTFDVTISSSFLLDIFYQSYEGISGTPNYWATWSASNVGGWETNIGLGTHLNNGDWFGCSYTNFSPNNPPSLPVAGVNTAGFDETQISIQVYPNPTNEGANILHPEGAMIRLLSMDGRIIYSIQAGSSATFLDLTSIPSGSYLLEVQTDLTTALEVIVKQ